MTASAFASKHIGRFLLAPGIYYKQYDVVLLCIVRVDRYLGTCAETDNCQG